MKSKTTRSITFSPASAVGPSPSALPDGPMNAPCGREAARASRSRRRAKDSAPPMPATCGRNSPGSSRTALLQTCLENRLRARLDVDGSPECELTWKRWDMASGAPICALRASARRTSGNGCIGWPSPNAQAANRGGLQTNPEKALERRRLGHQLNLDDTACLAGWCSPTGQDGTRGGRPARDWDTGVPLSQQAALAGWATPTLSDARGNHSDSWGQSVKEIGPIANGSAASMEKRGALNPAHSRWLMGFPAAWDFCGATAMQSCRK